MKLIKAVNEYIEYKRGLGIRGNTDAQDMKALCRVVGAKARVENITEKQIETFFAGKCCGPAVESVNIIPCVDSSDLPSVEVYCSLTGWRSRPNRSAHFCSYILGREELRRLFDAIPLHRRRVLELQTLTELQFSFFFTEQDCV